MLRSCFIVVIYFMFASRNIVRCQKGNAIEYKLQKISYDSRPNEQPLLLVGRKLSHLAIPKFLDNIPQIEFKYNEELVISCPEQSIPKETVSTVNSQEATISLEEQPSRIVTGEESRTDQTIAIEREGAADVSTTNLETTRSFPSPAFAAGSVTSPDRIENTDRIGTKGSSSTFDSVASVTMPSLPRVPELAEEFYKQEVVQSTVSKKKAKFYASEIQFPWELPYLKCERPAEAVVRKVNKTRNKKYDVEPCEDNGGKYEIGFWVKGHKSLGTRFRDAFKRGKSQPPKKPYEWHPFIRVCFNMHEWRPVYTKHTLYGSAIRAAAKLMLRPNNFDYEEDFQPYDKVDPALFYHKPTQYQLFVALLGTIAFTYNDTVSKFLIPLQLVDPAEMPTPLSTLTTYSYMATTPSWEGVALRNWRILTKKVLSFADENKVDLVIYSGTAHILQLQTANGELINIYLEYLGNKLAVAKILYKLVHNELTNEVIIFFVYNNPYVSDSSYQLCVDVCESTGWNDELWKNLDRGYTTCCNYKEVRNSFASLPQIKGDIKILLNRKPNTEPALTEMHGRFDSESAFTGLTEGLDQPSTSYATHSSTIHEIETS